MGADIWTFCEVYTEEQGQKLWRPVPLKDWDDPCDYELFYILAGARGYDHNTYPPIAPCRGLPEDINPSTIPERSLPALGHSNAVSYYTLKELKDSPYSRIMKLKMWVDADEYRKWEQLTAAEQEQYGMFYYVHVDTPPYEREGLVLIEREGYYNLNYLWIIQEMEDVKREWGIENEEDVRLVFWVV